MRSFEMRPGKDGHARGAASNMGDLGARGSKNAIFHRFIVSILSWGRLCAMI